MNHFTYITIKAFILSKKRCFGEMAVNNTDAVTFIKRSNQVVACIPDGSHVARRNKAGGSNKYEIVHSFY